MVVKKNTKKNNGSVSKKPVIEKKNKKNKTADIILKKIKKNIKISEKEINYSICISTDIITNCINLEQITNVIYQIAKAATMFNVGEIVVLDSKKNKEEIVKENKLSDSMLIASLLQYFVTPPYLVKSIFKNKYEKYFKIANKLPRLSVLPFMRYLKQDNGRYREGLAIRMEKPNTNNNNQKKGKEFKQTKYINIGKGETLELKSQLVPVNVRVTVDTIEKKVVSPEEAYGDFTGAKASYGYHVRVSKTFGDIFTECGFTGGYSQALWINTGDYYYDGTLKKYRKTETSVPYVEKIVKPETSDSSPSNIANVLLVFGKWDLMKKAFDKSKEQFEGCEGVHQFFDGQLELPGAVPQGPVPVQDGCMIALTLVSNL